MLCCRLIVLEQMNPIQCLLNRCSFEMESEYLKRLTEKMWKIFDVEHNDKDVESFDSLFESCYGYLYSYSTRI